MHRNFAATTETEANVKEAIENLKSFTIIYISKR